MLIEQLVFEPSDSCWLATSLQSSQQLTAHTFRGSGMCSGNMSTSWTKNHRNMDVHLLSLLKLLLRTLSPETLPLLVNIVYACCNTVDVALHMAQLLLR